MGTVEQVDSEMETSSYVFLSNEGWSMLPV